MLAGRLQRHADRDQRVVRREDRRRDGDQGHHDHQRRRPAQFRAGARRCGSAIRARTTASQQGRAAGTVRDCHQLTSGSMQATWCRVPRAVPAERGRRARRRRRSSMAIGQRGWNAQPVGGDSGLAGSPARTSGFAPRGRGRSRPAPGCTGGAGGAITCSAGPISTMRPRYITAIRSATTRATDRSWVTNTTDMSRVAAQLADEVEHGRGQRHVQRAGRLVAQQHRGRHHGRPGQRDPLALTAGQLPGPGFGDVRRAGRPGRAPRRRRRALRGATALAAQPLGDQLADRQPRRQRRAGVLEHHLRAGSPSASSTDARGRAAPARRSPAAASTCPSRSPPPAPRDSPVRHVTATRRAARAAVLPGRSGNALDR